jgi:hypothetical protein
MGRRAPQRLKREAQSRFATNGRMIAAGAPARERFSVESTAAAAAARASLFFAGLRGGSKLPTRRAHGAQFDCSRIALASIQRTIGSAVGPLYNIR